MVDLISSRTIDITKLAMDGLMARQKAISANTANVMTPDYKRKDVDFENQLREMINKDDIKQTIKEQNSIQFNPTSLDMVMDNPMQQGITPQQARYLTTDVYDNFNPQITEDNQSGSDSIGNNVDMEKEVMNMAMVGMRYETLATLEQKRLGDVGAIIKG